MQKNNRRHLMSNFFTKVKTHSRKKEQKQTTYILCRLRDTIRLYSYLISLTKLRSKKFRIRKKSREGTKIRRIQKKVSKSEKIRSQKKIRKRTKFQKLSLFFRRSGHPDCGLLSLVSSCCRYNRTD